MENNEYDDCCEVFDEDEIISVEDRRDEIIDLMTDGIDEE